MDEFSLAGWVICSLRMSVTAVARQVGYGTDAAFSNAFVRVMGVRPGAYRRAS